MFTDEHHVQHACDRYRDTVHAEFKEPKPCRPADVKAPVAIMLGGVPTIVMIPPQPQANAKGINWREAGIFAAAQIPKATAASKLRYRC